MKADLTQKTHALGLFEGISNEAYHASPGLSFSGAKLLGQTPAHYQSYLKGEIGGEETSARRLGSLVHLRLESIEKFDATVSVVDGHRGGKDVKEAIAAEIAQGKMVCKSDEKLEAIQMADAVLSHPDAGPLLKRGTPEVSAWAKDPATGILIKCRPDRLWSDEGIIIDYKTFSDLSIPSIEKQINNMKYHWQSAHYCHVISQILERKIMMFAHVFVQAAPFAVRVVVLEDAALEKAAQELAPIYQRLAECQLTNEWPSYPSGITTVTLPSWAW